MKERNYSQIAMNTTPNGGLKCARRGLEAFVEINSVRNVAFVAFDNAFVGLRFEALDRLDVQGAFLREHRTCCRHHEQQAVKEQEHDINWIPSDLHTDSTYNPPTASVWNGA